MSWLTTEDEQKLCFQIEINNFPKFYGECLPMQVRAQGQLQLKIETSNKIENLESTSIYVFYWR